MHSAPLAPAAVYDGYGALKGWRREQFMQPSRDERAYYARELAGTTFAGAQVLEIGFGNGHFLGWAREQGAAQLHGTEMLEQSLVWAAEEGVALLPQDLAEALPDQAGRFDLIAAFDVMEHISREDIPAFLATIATLLKPGGRFVARFPNGQSPFSLIYQHGDYTHVSILSAPIVVQLSRGLPFRTIYAGESARAIAGSLPARIAKHMRAALREMVSRALRFIYGHPIRFNPNATVILERI